MPVQEQEAIVKLLNKYYADFRPTHASEKLAEKHNLTKHPTTIRQIMIQAGLWQPRKQRRANYYSRRPRQPFFGQMIQFDGSYEYWFESRGPKCCLLASIDDATNSENVTRIQLCGVQGCCPVVEIHHDLNKVVITDDNGGQVTLAKKQWLEAIAKVKVGDA